MQHEEKNLYEDEPESKCVLLRILNRNAIQTPTYAYVTTFNDLQPRMLKRQNNGTRYEAITLVQAKGDRYATGTRQRTRWVEGMVTSNRRYSDKKAHQSPRTVKVDLVQPTKITTEMINKLR